MTFNQLTPSIGDFIQINSADWYVFTGTIWRKMTVDEQLEYSRK